MASAYYNENDPYAAQWLRNLIEADLIPPGAVDERSIVDVRPSDVAGFTHCHFFAGLGGWAYAARLAGWPDDRPLWTGSCPCQPFSVIGTQTGFADPRHLWPDFFRLIRASRPAVVVGEQVAKKAGYNWLDRVVSDLAGENYASRGVDIPACAVDAPHVRNRIYWIAHDLDDANDTRLEGHAGHVDSRTGRSREAGSVATSGRRNGSFWADHDWITGPDGKARRAKPGLPLLVNGATDRVGKLRAYGNAIVPPLAAEVLAAYLETEGA